MAGKAVDLLTDTSTTKSPLRLLVAAYGVGPRELRSYWHIYAPKKFTLPQLFACLVLKVTCPEILYQGL